MERPRHRPLSTVGTGDRETRHDGQNNPNARLTEAQVAQIKEALSLGLPGSHLAQQYGVSRQTISNIHTGRSWANVRHVHASQAAA